MTNTFQCVCVCVCAAIFNVFVILSIVSLSMYVDACVHVCVCVRAFSQYSGYIVCSDIEKA